MHRSHLQKWRSLPPERKREKSFVTEEVLGFFEIPVIKSDFEMNWAELPVSQDRSRNKLLAMRAYTEVGRFVIELPLCTISLASSQAPVVRNVISSPRDIVILDVNATGFLGQPRFPGKTQHLIHVWIGRRPTGHIRWKLLMATSQQWL